MVADFWKYFCFWIGIFFFPKAFSQDCLQPTVPNGRLVGDLTEGAAAAVLCDNGYTGGGPVTCSGGVWTALPQCTPRDCNTPTVLNGVLLGNTYYGGNALVNCDSGYEGDGPAICGVAGTWTSIPTCTAIDCGVPSVNHGSFQGDTTFGGAPFIQCDTGYTGGGTGVTCLATGEWDIQTACNPKSCGIPTVANGVLSGDNFYTGTASIVCNAGYQGGGTATCLATAQWDTLPTCSPKNCDIPTILHGTLSATSSTLYGGTAEVECDSGYTGGGPVTCLDSGNWGTIPACNPVDCGTPVITNGVLTGSTLFDGIATVTCNTGYEGGGEATCQASSTWATLPPCDPVDCGTPTITNGQLSATSDTLFGGTAAAECYAGYIGGGLITCQSSKTWTANPNPCTPVDCGTPTVVNGIFFGDEFYTGTANVVCNSGYTGSGSATCNTDGTWTMPTCTAKDCGTPTIANGVFSGDTFYGGTALVTCNTGYDGSGPATCGTSGTWTATPTCVAKDCGDPSIPHSTLSGDTLYDGGAFFACAAGYTGGGTATCTATGDWQLPLPSCTPKDCGSPFIANGALSADSSTFYDGTATVECNSGYEGGGTATCQTTATWATLPACNPVDCGNPNIENGYLTGGSTTTYDGTAIATCDSGYQLADIAIATCLADGTWDTLPICDPKDCGPLTDPVHGSVNYTATTYQNTATYTCESLWQLNGSNILTCEADGNWAPDPPTCDDIDCQSLTPPTNGAISTAVVKVGTTVIVSCDPTYTLFGDEVFQCETGGTWNVTDMGTCRKDCPDLTVPDFGSLSSTDVFEGAEVNITCDTAYTLEGASQLTCLPGGVWDNPLPVCTEDCQPLVVGRHVLISTSILSQGTIITVTCNRGYTLFGANILTCLTDASWDNPEPVCELDCPRLIPPRYGEIDTNLRSKNHSVHFSCNTGYTLFGQNTLTCQDNSKWDYTAPVCKKDCPALTPPENGELLNLDHRMGAVTNVSCFSGYTLFGVATLKCLTNSAWNYPMPKCRQDCPALTVPTNGAINTVKVSQKTKVKVTCSSGYTLFGASLLYCQNDSTWNNLIPDCLLDCPALTTPANGYINNTVTRSQGTVVGVVCKNLYTLFGASVLTCQSDSTWDDVVPDCRKDCSILVPPDNGAINITTESQGTVVGVTCNVGYTLFGDDILQCQNDALWDKVVPVCKKDCRSLVVPPNGAISTSEVSQDTVVMVTCDSGYTLFGSSLLICKSDATWSSTEPTCEKDCPALNILHSSISTTVVIMDTVVNVTCDATYTLEGVPQLTCVSGGVWNQLIPECTKDCPTLTPPTNGYLGSTAVSQGSTVGAFCNVNYTAFGDDDMLFGNQVLTCQTSAAWDLNVPTCRIDCPPMSVPSSAIFSTMETYEGIVVIVSCVTGYTRFGNQNITCTPGGFWDKTLPTCRKDCPVLVIPSNGNLDTADVKEGTVVTTICDSGYTLIGNPTVECLPGGKWNDYLPDCHRECGPLTAPAHGLVSNVDGTTLGKTASYACYTGYDLSHNNIRVCQANGLWSFTEPTCDIRDCNTIPKPANCDVSYSNGATTYLEIATFTCHPGYTLTGDRRRLCQKDYTWSGASPICVIKDCGSLGDPTFGSVRTAQGTTYGEVANYFCNVGYTLVGNSQRTCEADGRWSDLPPTCKINDCGNLTSPANGDVSFTSTVYNSIAYYSCHAGYDRIGSSSRVCLQTSVWSNTAPTCVIKDCGPVTAPDNGNVSYTIGSTSYEAKAIFTCDAGYTLIGHESRTCEANGKWGGSSPICQIKDCGTLPHPANGLVSLADGTTYLETATYYCNFGYTLVGVLQRQCTAVGEWSDTEPVCEINDCGNLDKPDNGNVVTVKTTYNQLATYTCNVGYTLSGVSQRVCWQDKIWSDSAPVCKIKDCGTPINIQHGSASAPFGTEYNATIVYNCDINYGMVGDDTVLCLSSGYWDTRPICYRDCGLPTEIENGEYILQTDSLIGATATYSCINGYKLIGDPNVTCLDQGLWESPPYCRLITLAHEESCYLTEQCNTSRSTCRSDGIGNTKCLCEDDVEIYDPETDICLAYCGFLTAPTNGFILLPSVPSEGQNVSYSCDVGFALNDVTHTVRTCLDTRQWSGTAPLCVTGCPVPTSPNHGSFQTPEGTAAGKFVYYSCDSNYSLVGDTYRECLADTTWNGNTPSCLKACEILGNIENGIVELSSGNWKGSVATYHCEKDYALLGTSTRTCEGDSGWSGIPPKCIYAIFSDILLVISSLLIFLVVIDIFVILAIMYYKYKKQKKKEKRDQTVFDDIDRPNTERPEVTPVENPDTAIPFVNITNNEPGRSSFRKPENIQVGSYTEGSKNIPQLPRKKRSVLHRIPKPKPLKKLKRPKFFTSDTPMAPFPTPRTIPNSALDEFADEKIAEMERYLKDDFGTPISSDANRRSTADEEKVSIQQVPSSRLAAEDKMVVMDFDDAQNDDLLTTRLEEPPRAGPSNDPGRDRPNLRERRKLQPAEDPLDPLKPHQRESDA